MKQMIVVVLNRRNDGWVGDVRRVDEEDEHRTDMSMNDVIKWIKEVEKEYTKGEQHEICRFS